jgi:glycosyltransferase involved in cell wall biosynthesis
MKILHVVASIHASTGGPAVSVTRLAVEQARLGHEVTIATLDYPHLGRRVEAPGVRVLPIPGGLMAVRGRGWSPALSSVVFREARAADVVHNHGLWMWPNAYAREAAVAAQRPLVISPRGMLEPWALGRSRFKKAVAWWLFERANLHRAALFHATAESEARSIRSLRLSAPVVVVPNGVDCPDLEQAPARSILEDDFPILRGRRWVAFLSRLHPKKGLDVLLHAWVSCVGHESAGRVLVLAGPDLTGYRERVESMVRHMGLSESVVLTGELEGEAKSALLAHAELFVLPSYSENFGLVVAEAMSWARPVITTTATPWTDLPGAGAGWCVPPEAGPLAAAMREAFSISSDRLDAMGLAGRRLVESRFRWKDAAVRLADVCAGGGKGDSAR